MPQSLACLLVHLTFLTKDRMPVITPEIEKELFPYLNGIAKNCDSPALAIGGASDHVHLLLSQARTWSLSDLVEALKTGSSKWIKTKGAPFKGFKWQTGYAAFSIGRSNEVAVRKYIARQREHHRKITFKDEIRAFLKKYRVDFDERYVWD
ncbi:MAG: IS200/IS605 family transposase [Planctomycetes bacterium]|nr:IS200/IS605 family transposase [Planctomycetota bacterium]